MSLLTGLDIYNELTKRFNGEPEKIKSAIQSAYFDFITESPWLFVLKDPPAVISTLAQLTGTGTFTKDSTSVTGLTCTVSTSLTGRKIFVDSESIPYRISAHTAAATTLTLDATYKEDSVTLGNITVFQDEYSLASDCIRPWRWWFRNDPSNKMDFISGEEMDFTNTSRIMYSNSSTQIAVIRAGKVRIYPWTDEAETIEYEYTYRPTNLNFTGTSETLVVPEDAASILVDMAIFYLHVDNNDERQIGQAKRIDSKMRSVKAIYLSQQKPRFTGTRATRLV